MWSWYWESGSYFQALPDCKSSLVSCIAGKYALRFLSFGLVVEEFKVTLKLVGEIGEGEAFAILQSLLWNIDLQLFSVIIETDCKFIADQEDILECGGNSQSH